MFFTRKTSNEAQILDQEIANISSALQGHEPHEEEYDAASDQLVKLIELKNKLSSSTTISPDTLAVVAANLLGIVMILSHERVHVIASKALSFVMKSR